MLTQDSDNSSEESEESEDDDDYGNESQEELVIDIGRIKPLRPLNVLLSFNCVTEFPALLQDLFDGVVAEDFLSIIKCLSSEGWLTFDAYHMAGDIVEMVIPTL